METMSMVEICGMNRVKCGELHYTQTRPRGRHDFGLLEFVGVVADLQATDEGGLIDRLDSVQAVCSACEFNTKNEKQCK